MKRWRYHSVLVRDLSIADAKLNYEGERGWELVNICLIDANSARAYFKQPIEDDSFVAPTAIESSLDQSLSNASPF